MDQWKENIKLWSYEVDKTTTHKRTVSLTVGRLYISSLEMRLPIYDAIEVFILHYISPSSERRTVRRRILLAEKPSKLLRPMIEECAMQS